MGLFGLLWMLVWGAIVGWIAKLIHPGEENLNLAGTAAVGIVGSFLGGFVAFLMGWSCEPISTSGWLFSILGAIGVCFLWVNKSKIRAWIEDTTGW